jgi:hypothetical protein
MVQQFAGRDGGRAPGMADEARLAGHEVTDGHAGIAPSRRRIPSWSRHPEELTRARGGDVIVEGDKVAFHRDVLDLDGQVARLKTSAASFLAAPRVTSGTGAAAPGRWGLPLPFAHSSRRLWP